jgi:hypothetical protein
VHSSRLGGNYFRRFQDFGQRVLLSGPLLGIMVVEMQYGIMLGFSNELGLDNRRPTARKCGLVNRRMAQTPSLLFSQKTCVPMLPM